MIVPAICSLSVENVGVKKIWINSWTGSVRREAFSSVKRCKPCSNHAPCSTQPAQGLIRRALFPLPHALINRTKSSSSQGKTSCLRAMKRPKKLQLQYSDFAESFINAIESYLAELIGIRSEQQPLLLGGCPPQRPISCNLQFNLPKTSHPVFALTGYSIDHTIYFTRENSQCLYQQRLPELLSK